jgi:uncharacterized protein (DUF58 family)
MVSLNHHQLAQRGEAQSLALPPLLVKAEKIAATVILGVHGRRAAGPGESFWQYRPYGTGDSTQRIDWHRSAQSDRVYIRENEWESANTLWLWANCGPRMNFRSKLAPVTKLERAQILALALASLASRAHERVGALGSDRPAGNGRLSLLRVAETLTTPNDAGLPIISARHKRAGAVLISDFLEPLEELKTKFTTMASANLRGHLLMIADPAEETLPYDGRVEFLGLDQPHKYLAPKVQDLRSRYIAAYQAHRDGVRLLAKSLGWSFTLHHTDASPVQSLLPLHMLISGAADRVGRT